ncbi:MAG: DUF503 domain-containing protein [Candidatus Euphemobacter frigidus]|nr:DUF503 domain-containing protein [Candidatus Euphemobacter frigidus]MDP8276463.1 DUF503 domain-containing protein [Candidatus Euphemobacter frigidus]
MRASLLVINIRLPGCRSLKEKRHRVRGIRDRFGKQSRLAVCESDYQNDHQRAQWTFIAMASDQKSVDRMLTNLEDRLEMVVDGVIASVHREHL